MPTPQPPRPEPWPFADPRNVATFTTKAVLAGAWIQRVYHDADDGAWQFLDAETTNAVENAALVALETVYKLDPSIGILADLPFAWCATRESATASWRRTPYTPSAD